MPIRIRPGDSRFIKIIDSKTENEDVSFEGDKLSLPSIVENTQKLGTDRTDFLSKIKDTSISASCSHLTDRLREFLNSPSKSPLLGVFGLDTNKVISDALRNCNCMNNTIFSFLLPGCDCYTCIAAAVMERMNELPRNNYVSSNLTNQMYRHLTNVLPGRNPSDLEFSDLSDLNELSRIHNRDEALKSSIKCLHDKEFNFNSNQKYVLVIIAQGFDDITMKVICDLEDIRSEEVCIILSSFYSPDLLSEKLSNGIVRGDEILQKFFMPDDIISC